jgi:hypothetical protein
MRNNDYKFYEESWNDEEFNNFKSNRQKKKIKNLKKIRREQTHDKNQSNKRKD